TIAIDLPLKILVWQDATGATWLSYNDPSWLAKRHGLSADVEATVSALTTAVHAVARRLPARSRSSPITRRIPAAPID
ncbi:MAG TPA: DUF302 domain-containing protein, partial [Steroidobacteraceae bacterium]|nr:DUF302 domain-containing protein [Steroidobacteraceae bacterium]